MAMQDYVDYSLVSKATNFKQKCVFKLFIHARYLFHHGLFLNENLKYSKLPGSTLLSLGTLVRNSRDRQGKLWLLKKQKTALKTTLQ